MSDHLDRPELFFAHPTMVWAKTGAAVGASTVLIAAVVLIVLTGQSMALFGIAALAAFFGGAGFGAMLGAVLAAIRASAEERLG